MSSMPTTLRWALLALAGLLVAIAVAVLAADLTSQRIGLASEPLRAGEALAPAGDRQGGDGQGDQSGDRQDETTTPTTDTAPTSTTTTTDTVPTTRTTTTSPSTDSETETESEAEGESDDD